MIPDPPPDIDRHHHQVHSVVNKTFVAKVRTYVQRNLSADPALQSTVYGINITARRSVESVGQLRRGEPPSPNVTVINRVCRSLGVLSMLLPPIQSSPNPFCFQIYPSADRTSSGGSMEPLTVPVTASVPSRA